MVTNFFPEPISCGPQNSMVGPVLEPNPIARDYSERSGTSSMRLPLTVPAGFGTPPANFPALAQLDLPCYRRLDGLGKACGNQLLLDKATRIEYTNARVRWRSIQSWR